MVDLPINQLENFPFSFVFRLHAQALALLPGVENSFDFNAAFAAIHHNKFI
ncbi:MAG: hypothetical protein H0U39_13955 [Segetibacter sp.]|jgi:hypothetical protein|nr:hypothetical protein [Segetibacter sp.]